MNKIAMLFMLVLLSGCATRHTEYADYREPYVVVSGPGYYWFETYRPMGYYHTPRHRYGSGYALHPSLPRFSAPHGASGRAKPRAWTRNHQNLHGGNAPKPEASPSRNNTPSAAPSRQGVREAPRASGVNRAGSSANRSSANRRGDAQSGGRGRSGR
ncbi:MAG: hypothetical protein LBJ59_11180 [Zoogloeaceae bacterium]|nr:hypothetical protein [Zoogloeaceae bacterium]